MIPAAAYLLGSYIAYGYVKQKETIIKITISTVIPSDDAVKKSVNQLLDRFKVSQYIIQNNLGITTTALGSYGISKICIHNTEWINDEIDVTLYITHRGTLEWSFKNLEKLLKGCRVHTSVLKK